MGEFKIIFVHHHFPHCLPEKKGTQNRITVITSAENFQCTLHMTFWNPKGFIFYTFAYLENCWPALAL